jgi:hypothetical protein
VAPPEEPGRCSRPTYTQLLVTVPDTTDTSTAPATFDACSLTVHPIGSDL